MDATSKTVARIIGSGIIPVALEIMDKVVMNMVEDSVHIGLNRDVEGTLLIMVDGEEATCKQQMSAIIKICKEEGSSDIQVAKSAKEEDDLWLARRSAFGVMSRKKPTCILEDLHSSGQ